MNLRDYGASLNVKDYSDSLTGIPAPKQQDLFDLVNELAEMAENTYISIAEIETRLFGPTPSMTNGKSGDQRPLGVMDKLNHIASIMRHTREMLHGIQNRIGSD